MSTCALKETVDSTLLVVFYLPYNESNYQHFVFVPDYCY